MWGRRSATEELQDGGKVLRPTAQALEKGVETLRGGPQRRRRAGLGRSLLGELEVLQHHGRRETAVVVAIRRRRRHRARPGAIAGQAPALAGRLRSDLEESLRVQPQLLGQREGL